MFSPRIIFALFCMLCVQGALAQGTRNLLPEPISTTRAIQYAEKLELDDAQRDLWLEAHARYLDEFFKLRESRIHDFLRETATTIVIQVPGHLPEPRAMRKFTSEHERIMQSIAALEERLFQEIRAALPEDKWQTLESARLARARERIISVFRFSGYLGVTQYVDLRATAALADLSEEELTLIEPDLVLWERAATPNLTDLPGKVYDLYNDFVEGCIAAGMSRDADERELPAIPEDVMRARLRIWQVTDDKVQEYARELLVGYTEHLIRIANRLPPDSGQRFRYARWLVTGGFEGEDVRTVRRYEPGLARLQIALERGDLTDEDRAAVGAAFTEFQRRWNAYWDERVRIEAEYGGTGYIVLSDEETQRFNVERLAKLRPLSERRSALGDWAASRLGEILGEEVARDIVRAQEAALAARRQRGVAEDMDNLLGTGQRIRENELFLLPPQITRGDLERYAQLLALDDDQKALADVFFRDYLAGLRDLRSGAFARLREAHADWNFSNPSKPTGPAWSDFEANDRARRDVIEAIATLDDALLRDLAAIAREEQRQSMPLVQLHRDLVRLTRFNRGNAERFEFYTGFRGNFIEAVLDAPLEEAARQQALAMIAAHSAALLDAARAHYEATRRDWLTGWRATLIWNEMQAKGLSNDGYQDHPARLAAIKATNDVNVARKMYVDLNREILGSLGFEPENAAPLRIRAAYLRNAYPHVYEDEEALFAPLRAALEIDDLTAEETAAIISLLEEAMRDYEGLCEEMCDLYATSPFQGMYVLGDLEAWDEYHARNEKIEHLKFKRTEVVTRARVALAEILGEERAGRLQLTIDH